MTNNERRQRNIAVFEDTMRCIEDNDFLKQSVRDSISQQEFISESNAVALPAPRFTESAEVRVSSLRSLEAAAQYADMGQHICVLNFASWTNPGGGVRTGSSAQEEALCCVSTLYHCLSDRQMWDSFYAPHRAKRTPLHNDDIIFTPDVQVIKDDDFRPLTTPFSVDIITCAAPNLREDPSNPYNPSDGDQVIISNEELLNLHIQRGRRVLDVAAAHQADVLILGALGCGAFRNDPHIVAKAYRQILPDYLHHFRTIEFAVFCRPNDTTNYQVFKQILTNI